MAADWTVAKVDPAEKMPMLDCQAAAALPAAIPLEVNPAALRAAGAPKYPTAPRARGKMALAGWAAIKAREIAKAKRIRRACWSQKLWCLSRKDLKPCDHPRKLKLSLSGWRAACCCTTLLRRSVSVFLLPRLNTCFATHIYIYTYT